MPAATARGPGAGRMARGHLVLLGVLCVIGLVIPVFVLVPVPKALHQAWYDVVAVDTFGGGYLRSTQNCWPSENRLVVTQYMTTPMGNRPPEMSSEKGMP